MARSKAKRPTWLWLLTGVVAGSILATLCYGLYLLLPERPLVSAVPTTTGEAAAPVPQKSQQFDFYTLLPHREAPSERASSSLAQGSSAHPKATSVQATDQTKTSALSQNSTPRQSSAKAGVGSPSKLTKADYLLQTGSFRSAQEAELMRAELILLGLNANVHRVRLAEGNIWHRVQIGPFTNQSGLLAAADTLKQHHINHIKVKNR